MLKITRTALTIFGFSIHWYGILIILGTAGGILLAMKREKRIGVPKDTTLDLALIGIPIAIICARLYYVAFSWQQYAKNPLSIFNIREGGLAIYGALIGGALTGLIYAKCKKIPFLSLADLAAPAFAFGQCIGRWGNFLNQEAYGRLCENPALNFFPVNVYIENSGFHYATFFYESLWCGVIVIVLLALERRGKFARRGDIFFSYLLMYALERAAVEGLRMDSLYLGPFRISQLLSMLAVWALLILLLRRRSKGIKRYLPLIASIAMGIALNSFVFSAVLGLCTLTLAAANYFSPEQNGRTEGAKL